MLQEGTGAGVRAIATDGAGCESRRGCRHDLWIACCGAEHLDSLGSMQPSKRSVPALGGRVCQGATSIGHRPRAFPGPVYYAVLAQACANDNKQYKL